MRIIYTNKYKKKIKLLTQHHVLDLKLIFNIVEN